jgi:hypothetical protein
MDSLAANRLNGSCSPRISCSGGRRGDRRISCSPLGGSLTAALPKNNRHGSCWLNFRCLANAMSLTS